MELNKNNAGRLMCYGFGHKWIVDEVTEEYTDSHCIRCVEGGMPLRKREYVKPIPKSEKLSQTMKSKTKLTQIPFICSQCHNPRAHCPCEELTFKMAGFIDDTGNPPPLLSGLMAGEDLINNSMNVCICNGCPAIPKLEEMAKTYRMTLFFCDTDGEIKSISNLFNKSKNGNKNHKTV